MELKDTVEMMLSSDYKERFKAEYYQVVIRYNKLFEMLEKWDNGTLNFTLDCPRNAYDWQVESMKQYIAALQTRAEIENINLEV